MTSYELQRKTDIPQQYGMSPLNGLGMLLPEAKKTGFNVSRCRSSHLTQVHLIVQMPAMMRHLGTSCSLKLEPAGKSCISLRSESQHCMPLPSSMTMQLQDQCSL